MNETAGHDVKSATRAMWAAGDYHRFATSTIWPVGAVLVDACDVSAGQRVLDVAAGTGNVAIRAAQRGAKVVASDLTPENFEAGRRAAAAEGVKVEWREGDAEALPFRDGEFDVVMSCFGAIFAPDHQAVARELARVCRPGGTIGMTTFTPEGSGGAFFRMFGPYMPPPPPGATLPTEWGREAHVKELFGDRVDSIRMTRSEYDETAPSARAYVDLFKETFGPMVAVSAALADRPERLAALDRDFLDFVQRTNRGTAGGPVQIPYEYLLIVARTR